MIRAQASILIARPTALVFDFVAVGFFENYRRWSPEVERLDVLTPGPIRVGSRARQVRTDQGRRTETSFRVAVLEPPRQLEFVESGNQFQIRYRFDPLGDATQLGFAFELTRLDLFMRPFEKLIRVTVQDGADRVVRNIKRLVEAEVTVQAASD
ncbi:SRPBCC family protein [Thioalkalicoccus limnaeus]|uniref:SRPBCC family protein n=1 Tax=Thioalkalicoccus limnaeus TaxID=120681 RepID=A0ABV4BG10_9GAMM